MIIFSERINGMYRDVRAAIPERNKQVDSRPARRSNLPAGRTSIDINIGPTKGDPVENFVWLAQTVHEVTDKPLSLDSAKADLLVEVVPRGEAGPARHQAGDQFLHGRAGLYGQADSARRPERDGHHRPDDGPGRRAGQRREADRMRGHVPHAALEAGIAPEDIYIDPIILPINAAFKQQENVVEGIRQLAMVNDPPPHFIIGLSNVSTEMPAAQAAQPDVPGDVPDGGPGRGHRGCRRPGPDRRHDHGRGPAGKTPLQRRLRQGMENAKRIAESGC